MPYRKWEDIESPRMLSNQTEKGIEAKRSCLDHTYIIEYTRKKKDATKQDVGTFRIY